MENLPMNEFRRQVGEYINQTYYAGKAFTLTKGEKKVAVLLPIAMLDRLTELEAFYNQTLADRQSVERVNMDVDNKQTDEKTAIDSAN